MEGEDSDLRENRFSYLLQPIRDLAANWDINIAGELEEYLDELEHITFTIEGSGGSTLNFAEAALLIQVGGACHGDDDAHPEWGRTWDRGAVNESERCTTYH
jgi:hypothetical protein